MKMLLNLFLTLSVFITSAAQAGVADGLKVAFDEYHYAITVDWDQKDEGFKRLAESELSDKLEVLKEEGMTQNDVIEFFLSRPQSKAFGQNLKNRLDLINLNLMSKDEALYIFNEVSNSSYQAGANWNGNSQMTITFVVIGALALTVLGLWAAGTIDCNNVKSCQNCESQTVCK